MAAEDRKHQAIGTCNKFHGEPGCNYRAHCDPPPDDWDIWAYQTKEMQRPQPWQAHHVLPIAALKKSMQGLDTQTKEYLERCKAKTDWCINQSPNMLALPVFGHTVKWYIRGLARNGEPRLKGEAPPFANWPQHDWQHTGPKSYMEEVINDLKQLWHDMVSARGPHTVNGESIAQQLEDLSLYWKETLRVRGGRSGGTHKAFTQAMRGDDRKWYYPFSMADDPVVQSRKFPFTIKEKSKALVERLRKAISTGGGP